MSPLFLAVITGATSGIGLAYAHEVSHFCTLLPHSQQKHLIRMYCMFSARIGSMENLVLVGLKLMPNLHWSQYRERKQSK